MNTPKQNEILKEYQVLVGWKFFYTNHSSPKNDIKLKEVKRRMQELHTQALLLGIQI